MAGDEKEGEEASTRGADWEVVQLTESTYAAVPIPERFTPEDERSEYVSSNAMFMSDHFVFPPSEHENLPIKLDYEHEVQDVSTVEEDDDDDDDGGFDETDDDLDKTRCFDNGGSLSVRDGEFEEGKGLQEPNLFGEEGSGYVTLEPNVLSQQNLYSPKYSKAKDGDEHYVPGLPCEAWWKRHATYLYRHAKEASTIWPVFVAAALMGLVILGKGWQH